MSQSTVEAHSNGHPQVGPSPAPGIDSSTADIERIFTLQRGHQFAVAKATVRERKEKLRRLHKAVLAYKEEIRDAMHADFRKHPSEVDLTEIYPVTSEIKHAIRHLSAWMRPRRVSTPIALLGSKSYIHYEPKGVVLIISPWNYPFNLTFGPLVSAIASGNCVMVKPSEHTPHSSAVMGRLVREVFDETEVALIEGGVETSQALLALPFNHIFFTGAPSIGKVVMEAAAKHLTSVTLELGGKSPTIVDETANVNAAAKRVAWAKFTNSGQTCIAPDYLFVHESKKDEFVQKFKETVESFYGKDASRSESYSHIVNERHYGRIKGYLDEAEATGARVLYGGRTDPESDYIEPTLITDVDPNTKLMTDEIFGPVLPLYTFRTLDEPLALINSKEKPLAIYIYSNSQRNVDRIIENTRAGGTAINHSGVYFFNNDLPFGGSNHSGIGKGHGFFGFEAFSNARGVFKQVLPLSAVELMSAPYNAFKQKLIDLSIKFF